MTPQKIRPLLIADAAVTGANGLAYVAAATPLGDFLGLDPGLLLTLGAVLVVYALGVAALAARRRPPVAGTRAVVEINLAWTAASLVALAFWLEPSTAGAVWVVAQALAVGTLAVLQHLALRAATARSQPAAA
ncbi:MULTISPECIES: hypothetical protein [Streptomyces]|uniref:Integral membrane protein n=1 Tax=Streptomyces xanthii TaxID=2768069 RepID=A0A7H1B3D6_9ACTN|nr:hypothetical protein [Streptomyces xanthii]QNS03241.1 hypothetical protein IAG42_06125 [Streptomyces xanthii]